MKVSFITTVFNEEKTIEKYVESLFKQTTLPDEIIIVDGGSHDKTLLLLKKLQKLCIQKKILCKVFHKPGNRSVGRNEAIRNATNEIIVCSDSGNILDKNWVKNITKPFKNIKVDVVAGYYEGKANNLFQKSVIPYALVMEDKVNPKAFLPATRSVAFRKSIWEKVGGFDEKFSHNEDYVFARNLRAIGAKIVFAKDAIVYWLPRNTFKQFFIMLWRFAVGDAEAQIARPTVLLLFARYFLGIYWLFLCILFKSIIGIGVFVFLIICYLLWSIQKNYRYVKDRKALFYLPTLQFTADAAVLSGTLYGLFKLLRVTPFISKIKTNKVVIVIISAYTIILFLTLHWGIPNTNHPFPYHMDEWHQLHAVGTTFSEGTPNTEGSANGTMLHFLVTGFYLIPFTFVQYINPFELQLDKLLMRERVFEVLRLQTIILGILSLLVVGAIAKQLNASKILTVFLFAFTPLFLMLSGYFKYDIALLFVILFSLFTYIRFAKDSNTMNFLLAGIPTGLAVAVKISAVPLLILYIFSFFWFMKHSFKKLPVFAFGIACTLFIIILFGFPDTLFGKGNILYYLYDNIIYAPTILTNYNLPMHPLIYLFTRHYPLVFGYGLLALFIFSTGFFVYQIFKKGYRNFFIHYKKEIFLFIGLIIFVFSLVQLQLFAAGNRSLVLLPFLVLIISAAFRDFNKIKQLRFLTIVILVIACFLQLYQSFAFLSMKFVKSPQVVASEQMQKIIPQTSQIGLENIPIYQMLPELVQKEFYFSQYKIDYSERYRYIIVDSKTPKLPKYIVITNGDIESMLMKKSAKKDLISRIKKEGYKEIMVVKPDMKYFNTLGNDTDYYFSGLLVASPVTTVVYKK